MKLPIINTLFEKSVFSWIMLTFWLLLYSCTSDANGERPRAAPQTTGLKYNLRKDLSGKIKLVLVSSLIQQPVHSNSQYQHLCLRSPLNTNLTIAIQIIEENKKMTQKIHTIIRYLLLPFLPQQT